MRGDTTDPVMAGRGPRIHHAAPLGKSGARHFRQKAIMDGRRFNAKTALPCAAALKPPWRLDHV
jgi:hypothetical protein